MSSPTGPITTKIPNVSTTVQWEAITQFDQYIEREAAPVGWPVERVRSHIAIESQGLPLAKQPNPTNGDSYGLMQVVPFGVGWEGWHELVKQKARLPKNASRQQVISALYDPAVNIACGVAILESFYQQHGTLDKASSAFFTGRSDWGAGDSVNGTTGKQYQRAVNGLIAEQEAFAPVGPTRQQVADLILGGVQVTSNTFGFNQPNYNADGSPANLYKYGVGHGTSAANMHTGNDLFVPLGTRVHTPLAGVVRCVGNQGSGDWGQGCGSFNDTLTGGVGNVTVLTDAGLKITFGHVNRALVTVGQRVNAGDAVATSGGMFSPHLHLDVSEQRNGSYWLDDPIPAIIKVMGGTPVVTYPEPNDVPQPAEFDVSVEVTATRDGVPVLQRAALDAPQTMPPLKKGDTFNAVYQVVGNDRTIYWVTTRSNRVPVDGTSAPEWNGGGPIVLPPEVNLPRLRTKVEEMRLSIDAMIEGIQGEL